MFLNYFVAGFLFLLFGLFIFGIWRMVLKKSWSSWFKGGILGVTFLFLDPMLSLFFTAEKYSTFPILAFVLEFVGLRSETELVGEILLILIVAGVMFIVGSIVGWLVGRILKTSFGV